MLLSEQPHAPLSSRSSLLCLWHVLLKLLDVVSGSRAVSHAATWHGLSKCHISECSHTAENWTEATKQQSLHQRFWERLWATLEMKLPMHGVKTVLSAGVSSASCPAGGHWGTVSELSPRNWEKKKSVIEFILSPTEFTEHLAATEPLTYQPFPPSSPTIPCFLNFLFLEVYFMYWSHTSSLTSNCFNYSHI